jgi:hypothetical protein
VEWHLVKVGEGTQASQTIAALTNAFAAALAAPHGEGPMAIFEATGPEGGALYFSPSAANRCRAILERFPGRVCPKPSRDTIRRLVAGGGEAWRLF